MTKSIIGLSIIIAAGMAIGTNVIMHQELTQTQLFVDYWFFYVLIIITIGADLIGKNEKT